MKDLIKKLKDITNNRKKLETQGGWSSSNFDSRAGALRGVINCEEPDGLKVNEFYEEWCVLEKEIKFDNSYKDNIKIRTVEYLG